MRSKSSNILIALILVSLAFLVLIYFVFADIKNRNEHISSLQHDLLYQVKNREYLTGLQQIIENANSDLTRMNSSIIDKEGDIKFIENIESIARKHGLTVVIDSLVFEDSLLLASSSMTSLKVKARTTGSWDGNYKFLAELESLPIKIRVRNYSFSNGGKEAVGEKPVSNGGNLWTSDFEFNVLKYK